MAVVDVARNLIGYKSASSSEFGKTETPVIGLLTEWIKDKEIERVVFNEITKKAVIHGIENPRQIEPLLVDAYMARRALDYLVGFCLLYTSPSPRD